MGVLPQLMEYLTNTIWINILVKGVVWIVPLLLLLRNDKAWLIKPTRMFCLTLPWFACVGMLCVSTAFLHTVRLMTGRENTFVIWEGIFLVLSISAGVIEEISFRGFIFNRQASTIGKIPAAIINGFLFEVFHYPQLILGKGLTELFTLRSLLLWSVGFLFSLAFAKWKNIILLIIVHSFWNVLSYIFALSG